MVNRLKVLVVDVDGTMTDSGIYYDDKGGELKKFCTKDAAGFFAAKKAGIEIMILTGRESAATARRMKELKVDAVYQNVKNKKEFLLDYMQKHNIHKEEIGYIGDDLNDLGPMRLTGFVGCPADSCREVKVLANYVSGVKGGQGAVRDVIEYLLRESGEWDEVIENIYETGV